MKAFTYPLLAACLAAAVCSIPTLTMAGAEGVRLQVGDIGTPSGAKAFDQQLQRAEHRLCLASYAPNDLEAMASCQKAVREEALAQLTPAQLQAYNEASRAADTLASAR